MELTKDIEIFDLAILLKKERALILADFHVGIEEAMIKQGVQIPKHHFKDLITRIEKIFKKTGSVDTMIINGDLKHEFGTISGEEWRNALKVIMFLKKYCKKIILIKGNHDKIIEPITKKESVKDNLLLADNILLGDVMITHGDKIPEIPRSIKTIIIAHEHPAVTLDNDLRQETYKCFLKGKFKTKVGTKTLIVQPSMNPLSPGTDILSEKLLSPFLDQKLDDFKVFIVENEVYDFGRLNKLYKLKGI